MGAETRLQFRWLMTSFDECTECDLHLSRYESAGLALAKVQNALDIAERLRDIAAVRQLVLGLRDETERFREAQSRLGRHRSVHRNHSRLQLFPGHGASRRAAPQTVEMPSFVPAA